MVAEEIKSLGFTERHTLVFRKDGNTYVSRLKNGKVCLLDKKEKFEVEVGLEYECLVKELPSVAFARVLSEAFIPRIILKENEVMIITQTDGETKRDIVENINEALEKINEERIMLINRK
jgi:hypothetical protein